MVSIEHRGESAVLTVSNPPVNAVSGELASALAHALDEVIRDNSVAVIVIAGAGANFIAGADIRMLSAVIEGTADLPDLNTYLFKMEQSPKPVIAAIRGAAMGGGLETAMAAHYRIASGDVTLGQPEVKLGLIPGMGGTQRLPRLVGFDKALEMCVFGEPIGAEEALRAGLLDRIAEGDLLEEAIEFGRSVGGRVRRTSRDLCSPSGVDFEGWRKRARKKRRGEEAPLAAIDAVEAAALAFDAGFLREQELFRQHLRSPQAAAMLHVFFGERTVAKIPGLRSEVKPRPIRKAAILGAGFMGSGIAMVFANAGIPVRLSDVSEASLAPGTGEHSQTVCAARRRRDQAGFGWL